MDLSIVLEDTKLNIRATAIIIHNNKLLVHQNKNDDYCALIGGRVKIGEDSKQTIKREIMEELGKEIEVEQYLTTIENFFQGDEIKYHEIMFVYKVEFKDEKDKKIEYSLQNMEGDKDLIYNWVDLKEIESKDLRPTSIKEMIKNGKFISHIINK